MRRRTRFVLIAALLASAISVAEASPRITVTLPPGNSAEGLSGRLLLILSDGRPEDYDDGGDRRYLHEDTRMAVKEAVARGVHPFCITVDTMANQYLPQIFGKGHYLVLDHINSLPNKLPEIYFRLRR